MRPRKTGVGISQTARKGESVLGKKRKVRGKRGWGDFRDKNGGKTNQLI